MSADFSIPGYEIGKKIGEGGFAKVYLAEQISLQRNVALKVVAPELVSDKEFCERFIKEGRIVARISEHPNIITIHDIGCYEGSYYMSMEYVAGGTLSEKIRAGDTELATSYIRDIARALDVAHQAGFVHRDIKPANILFKLDGTPVLTDFGIAKSLSGATQLTQAGFAVGTPDYMSPEQAMSKTLDGRSDLYSLGVVFYELLVGSKPFAADDAFSLAVKHINEAPPPLPADQRHFQPILDRLLAKSPDDRFASAAELVSALDQTIPDEPSMAGAKSGKNKSGGRVWTIGLGVAAAVVMSAAAVVAFVPDDKAPDIATEASTALPVKAVPDLANYPPKVQRLLDVALLHEDFGRINEPPGSNACEAYDLVLDSDPDNEYAKSARARLDCK